MMLRAAIALIVLATPAIAPNGWAQRGAGHAGVSGGGFSGHAGFSGSGGISRPGSSFVRPAQSVPYRASGNGYQAVRPPSYGSLRAHYAGNRFATSQTSTQGPYRQTAGSRNGFAGSTEARNRERWDARRRSFDRWYAGIYPAWLGYGYPYLLDPGFYDWSEPDDSAYDQGGLAPYADYGYDPSQEGYGGELPPWDPNNPPMAAPGQMAFSEPAPELPLTVIFKSGRAPVTMQNYMMTGGVLTDLDAGHYARIPVDDINVAETQRVNDAAGVEFRIP
jgi:hypothetical protein